MRLTIVTLGIALLLGASASAAPPKWSGPEALIPSSAPFVLLARSPAELLETLAASKALDKHGALVAEVREGLKAELGADVFTEAGWKHHGLDVRKPAALVCLDIEKEAWVVWLGLGDAAAVEALVTRHPRAEPVKETVGDAVVLLDANERPVILRGGYVAIGLSLDRAAGTALASVAAEGAFATGPGVAELTRTAAAADAAIWLDVKALFEADFAHQERRYSGPTWSEQELARVKAEGGDPARVQDLEKAIADEKASNEQWLAQAKADRARAEEFYGAIKGLAVGVTLGGQSLEIDGHLLLSDGDRLRPLLENDAALGLTRALAKPPLMLMEGRFDVAAVLDGLTRAIGQNDMDAITAGMRNDFGIDLATDIRTLAGDVGFALTGLKATPGQPDWAVAASVTDPSAWQALLKRASESEAGGRMISPGKKGYQLKLWSEDDGAVFVDGSWLVAGSDRGLTGRVAAPPKGGLASKTPNKALGALLASKGVAGIFAMDAGLYFLSIARFMSSAPSETPSTSASDDKTVALMKALNAAQKAQHALREKRNAERFKWGERLAGVIGTTAITVTVAPDGLTVHGGQYFGGATLAKTLDDILGAIESAKALDRKYESQLRALDEKIDDLYQKLQDNGSN